MTTFIPGPTPIIVKAADGKVLTVPTGWILLPLGAALTRRVKADVDHWVIPEKKGIEVRTVRFKSTIPSLISFRRLHSN